MRLHIFGASGSGVTTLGRALAKDLHVPYFDNDTFFWEASVVPFTVKRTPQQRNALLENTLATHPQWILGGSMVSWNCKVVDAFDAAVFLWIPGTVRMQRLQAREYERYGDIIFTDPERKKTYEAFLDWASDYDDNPGVAKRTLKAHEQWLKNLTCPVLEIRADITTQERINIIKNWLQQNAFQK